MSYCKVVVLKPLRRCAASIDLVLLSHGDLAHAGLYAYAYSHWGLTAPAYTTLPVQAMARIAATEDVEGVRDEEDFEGEDPLPQDDQEMQDGSQSGSASPTAERVKSALPEPRKRKYVATVQEVHDAFDSVNVLRYSQPCHLQGDFKHGLLLVYTSHPSQESVRA